MSESSGTHDRIERAARGELPEWAEVQPDRREHIDSVAELMTDWAAELNLAPHDKERWIAAAFLHDALRNADPEALDGAGEFPARVRHGPAVAARLEAEGVDDREVLDAIRYHTIGHPSLGPLGRYLYLADYLEPGRGLDPESAALRARLPGELAKVLVTVCARRIAHQLSRAAPLHRFTVDFWNSLVVQDG